MRNSNAGRIALGGLLAALAVVIMCLVGLIPVATFVCPLLCMFLCDAVLCFCGKRIAGAWYTGVSILCLLLAPDKEGALVFLFLGYYPIVRPALNRTRLSWLWKFTLFNCVILVLYGLVIRLVGMDQLLEEFSEMGTALLLLTLLLGNVAFFLADRVLARLHRKLV